MIPYIIFDTRVFEYTKKKLFLFLLQAQELALARELSLKEEGLADVEREFKVFDTFLTHHPLTPYIYIQGRVMCRW